MNPMYRVNRIFGGLCAGLLVLVRCWPGSPAARLLRTGRRWRHTRSRRRSRRPPTSAPPSGSPPTRSPISWRPRSLCLSWRRRTTGSSRWPAASPPTTRRRRGSLTSCTQLWACNNASDSAAVLALFTEQAIQETVGNTDGASWDMAELRADVAAALTPGDPRPAEEWASIDGIVSILAESDGRIGVLVLNSDPLVAEGDQVLDYFAFSTEGDATRLPRSSSTRST